MAVLLRSPDPGIQTGHAAVAGAASGEGGQGRDLEWRAVARCPRNVAGMPAYLLAPGPRGGLLGAGRIRYGPLRGARDGQPGTVAYRLLVEWRTRLPFAGRLPFDVLAAEVPSFDWAGIHRDLVTMPGDSEATLDRIWAQWAADSPRDSVRRFPHPRPPTTGALPLASGHQVAPGAVAPPS